MRTAPLSLLLAVATFGCGGGVPLLYPARTLATGDVRASAGGSATFVVGGLSSELAAGRAEVANAPPGIAPPPHDPRYAQAALVLAAVAPGVAPYVSARVGLGDRFEGGVTYTGRVAHLDVRRSFDWNDVSLSIGLGIETPIYGDSDSAALPQLDLSSIRGYGADVPILIGWESSARAYMLWAGGGGGGAPHERGIRRQLPYDDRCRPRRARRSQRGPALWRRSRRPCGGLPPRARGAGDRRGVPDRTRHLRGDHRDGARSVDEPRRSALVDVLTVYRCGTPAAPACAQRAT